MCRRATTLLSISSQFKGIFYGTLTNSTAQGLMSIGKLILHYWLSILSQFRVEIMCYNNLAIISSTHQLGTSAGGSTYRQYMAQPHYTREQLINMSSKLKSCKFSILPFSAIEAIRKLKINKRPSKLGSRLNKYTSKVNTKI